MYFDDQLFWIIVKTSIHKSLLGDGFTFQVSEAIRTENDKSFVLIKNVQNRSIIIPLLRNYRPVVLTQLAPPENNLDEQEPSKISVDIGWYQPISAGIGWHRLILAGIGRYWLISVLEIRSLKKNKWDNTGHQRWWGEICFEKYPTDHWYNLSGEAPPPGVPPVETTTPQWCQASAGWPLLCRYQATTRWCNASRVPVRRWTFPTAEHRSDRMLPSYCVIGCFSQVSLLITVCSFSWRLVTQYWPKVSCVSVAGSLSRRATQCCATQHNEWLCSFVSLAAVEKYSSVNHD